MRVETHSFAYKNEELVQTTNFDWDEIDRNVFGVEEQETQVDYSDMVAALSLIFGWICASPDLSHVGDPVYLTGT
jgi:hypothetical protein